MVQKQIVAIKLPKEEVEDLKTRAAIKGMTVTDLVTASIKGHAKHENAKTKIKSLEAEIVSLEERHKAMTGKKPILGKRISFQVSTEEFNKFNLAAAHGKTSKSEILREALGLETQEQKAQEQKAKALT